MRMYHTANNGDTLTLQGDYYDGTYGEPVTSPTLVAPFSQTSDHKERVAGDNLLGLWAHVVSPTSGFTLQLHYARSERSSAQLAVRRDIADIDFQQHLALGTRQNLVRGLGYRFTNDQLTNSQTLQFTPQSRRLNLWSGFLQDEIALLPKAVTLTPSRLRKNSIIASYGRDSHTGPFASE